MDWSFLELDSPCCCSAEWGCSCQSFSTSYDPSLPFRSWQSVAPPLTWQSRESHVSVMLAKFLKLTSQQVFLLTSRRKTLMTNQQKKAPTIDASSVVHGSKTTWMSRPVGTSNATIVAVGLIFIRNALLRFKCQTMP